MLEIRPVETKKEWNQFIDFPWEIYKGNENWVPPLKIAVRDVLNVNKNPFFKHATMRMFLALRDSKTVGRIVAVVDDAHNKFHEEKTGFFGFFECIDDQEVANKLFDTAYRWIKDRGMATMRGPMSPSTNHECGLLVEGYNDPPQVMMTYNPQYYEKLFQNWGLTKSKDLFAYKVCSTESKFSERMMMHAEKLREKEAVTLRTINVKKFDEEVEKILEIYNDAWEKNWGFVPMGPDEFRHTAKEMKAIMDPALAMIVEKNNEMVAFGLAVPDVNQAIKKIPNGKLLPFGLFKLLWNLKGPGKKKTINRCRIITLGIKQKYRNSGIGPLLYVEYLKQGPGNGYPVGEASWILEDNIPMNRALEGMGAFKYKTYRVYDRAIQ